MFFTPRMPLLTGNPKIVLLGKTLHTLRYVSALFILPLAEK